MRISIPLSFFYILCGGISIGAGLLSSPAHATIAKRIAMKPVETSNPNLIKVQDYIGQEYTYTYPLRAQRLTYDEALMRATPYAKQRYKGMTHGNEGYTVSPQVVPGMRNGKPSSHDRWCAAHQQGNHPCGPSYGRR